MITRRNFLQIIGIGSMQPAVLSTSSSSKSPICIATWDSGKEVAKAAYEALAKKASSLDSVEIGAKYIEATDNCCVGLNGYPDRDGMVSLDASIMDYKGNSGAVGALEQIKHPISVARKIMETTPHVMLVGKGAQQFALNNGFNLEPATLSESANNAYKEWLKEFKYAPEINIENKKERGPFAPLQFNDGSYNHDTMGLLALDSFGNLAGACTTSGMAFKLKGRVGDSPIIGAGLFVDNEIGAVTSSGVGEAVIKVVGSHLITEYMRQGFTPTNACKKAIERIAKQNGSNAKNMQVGFIALHKNGSYGAFALQKGFSYAIHSAKEVITKTAASYFK
jgi:N4-(beta-N-acetylglucosaminyl)-L-asparaginase